MEYPDYIKIQLKELENTKNEMRHLKNQYEYLEKVYEEVSKDIDRKKKKYNFSNKKCSNCYQDLTRQELEYKNIFCDECCSNDSCLDSHLYDFN